MFLLPKGKHLAVNVPIARLQLPDALDKLKTGKVTGLVTFDFPSANCALIYENGILLSALLRRNSMEFKNADALRALVDLMVLSDSGRFNVYGLSNDANQALLALICGDKIIDKQDLKQINFKSLLERIKNEHMTAMLKIYTDQRVGMIMYLNGATIGFFHDAAQTIESTSGEVQHIAALAGAAVDLFVLKENAEVKLDLSGQVNIRALWKAAKKDVFATPEHTNAPQPSPPPPAEQTPAPATNSADIEAAIIVIAYSIVGKLGKTLVEKELANIGGIKALRDAAKLSEFLNAVEKSSKLLASANKIREMSNAISSEVVKL